MKQVPTPSFDESLDARELAAYVPIGDQTDQQAAAWLLRRQAGLDAAQTTEFQAWLAASTAHREALARHEATWAELDALPAAGIAALKAAMAQPSPAQPRRRAWLRLVPQAAFAMLALTVTGGGWLYWQQPTYVANHASARGQQLRIDLPDGSSVQLDTGTRIEVALYRQRREVRLMQGQAMFSVQANASQPFDVLAGATRVTVLGTRFAVRNTPGQPVQVEVEEGRVRVAPADTAASTAAVLLTAGQRAEAHDGGITVQPQPAAAVALWREGRLSFDGTPLSTALAEFERYGDTHLRIDDSRVAALTINGSFDARRPGNFAYALTRVLPVRLEKRDGLTVIAPAITGLTR